MARTRQSKTQNATKQSATRRAPFLRENQGKDGRFKVGNIGGPGAPAGGLPGAGTPSARENVRARLRYRLEEPSANQLNVSFTPADRIALRMIRELDAITDHDAYLRCAKSLVETAYGTRTETEDVTPRRSDSEIQARLAILLEKAGHG